MTKHIFGMNSPCSDILLHKEKLELSTLFSRKKKQEGNRTGSGPVVVHSNVHYLHTHTRALPFCSIFIALFLVVHTPLSSPPYTNSLLQAIPTLTILHLHTSYFPTPPCSPDSHTHNPIHIPTHSGIHSEPTRMNQFPFVEHPRGRLAIWDTCRRNSSGESISVVA